MIEGAGIIIQFERKKNNEVSMLKAEYKCPHCNDTNIAFISDPKVKVNNEIPMHCASCDSLIYLRGYSFIDMTAHFLFENPKPFRGKAMGDHEKKNEGRKDDQNKPDMSLLPMDVLKEVTKVLDFGVQKYGRDNWKKVANAKNRYMAAMLRHITEVMEGHTEDPDTKLHPILHVACCSLFLSWFYLKDETKKQAELKEAFKWVNGLPGHVPAKYAARPEEIKVSDIDLSRMTYKKLTAEQLEKWDQEEKKKQDDVKLAWCRALIRTLKPITNLHHLGKCLNTNYGWIGFMAESCFSLYEKVKYNKDLFAPFNWLLPKKKNNFYIRFLPGIFDSKTINRYFFISQYNNKFKNHYSREMKKIKKGV